ncbi:MAG: hypothetical protein OSJ68_08160, partial [Clostridia bacterium]|nr:hypothetical protein [Clostridia bacterium]
VKEDIEARNSSSRVGGRGMKNLIERTEYLMCKRKPYLKNKQKRLQFSSFETFLNIFLSSLKS